MPATNYDLGILITLNIFLTIIGLSIAVFGVWVIMRQLAENTREMMHEIGNLGAMTQNVAAMTREVLRRTEE